MADVHELRSRWDDMAQARLDARRTAARRDAAVALIEARGSATAEELDAYLAEVFTAPTVADLGDQMARKAHAAVEHADRMVAAAHADLDAAHQILTKARARVEHAEAAVAEAEQRIRDTETDRDHAAELAEYARRFGDPGADQPATATTATAEPASVDGATRDARGET